MRKPIFILLGVIAFLLSFRIYDAYLFNIPKNWPQPYYDFSKNELSAQKIELGRILFYDPILSANNKISCASCHSPYSAFTHIDHDLSHGIDDRIGTRNSPTLMNLAWQKTFMWDGAINHLDVQALAPISHPDEMGSNITDVVKKLSLSKKYKNNFYAAFGDSLITGEKTLKCISQFLLTLVSANSKYDKVKRGEENFTQQEENGYLLFKTNCASCHKEPLFTSGDFAINGIQVDTSLNDFGRMKVTKLKADSLKFKIPSLRNIEMSYPYMHDGRFKKLSQVLNHYTSLDGNSYVSPELKKLIKLSSNEKVDLTAFLLTLTDKEFLLNPKHGFIKN